MLVERSRKDDVELLCVFIAAVIESSVDKFIDGGIMIGADQPGS